MHKRNPSGKEQFVGVTTSWPLCSMLKQTNATKLVEEVNYEAKSTLTVTYDFFPHFLIHSLPLLYGQLYI